MKYRLRDLTCLLVLSLLFMACSPQAEQAVVPEANILGDDPVAAINEILEISDRFDRSERLLAALRAVPLDQPEILEAVMDKLRVPFRELDRVLIISAWAKSDPAAATKWVMRKQREELLRATMFNETVYAWALKDPESLRTDFKVGMYSIRGWDSTMLRAFVRGWYDSGKPEIEDFIRDLRGSGDDRQRAVSELIKNKLEDEGPDAMIAWATTLKGSPTYRSYVFSRLAADIAKTNPLRAVEWCAEVCDLKVAENMPHWIASSWVKEGGVDAMNWIMGQSFESISVRTGVRSTFRRFQIGFPEESDAWVEGLSEEDRNKENFQGPVIMYVSRQSNLNRPEHAIEWTKYIENDWERDRSLMQIGSQWLRKDEQAAEVWLVATTLVTDDKKALLRDGLRKRKAKSEKVRKELELKPAWVIDRDEVS